MPCDFVVIVGELDSERFRRFRLGRDRSAVESITGASGDVNIWALGQSASDDVWLAIKNGDRMFFAEDGSRFSHCGIVSNTLIDRSVSIKLWSDSPRIRLLDRIVLFSAVLEISEPYAEMCRNAGIERTSRTTTIHRVDGRIKVELPINQETDVAGVVIDHFDTAGPADKKSEVVTRFVRDTKKVRQLKAMYGDRCQICGYVIQMSAQSRYSEVHHLHPLKDGGDDDFKNMMVLCPNHHVEFDYKTIGISIDKKTIINRLGKNVGELTTTQRHALDTKNIKFHLEGMQI